MSEVKKARHLFQQAGLTFPAIPDGLAERLKELDQWLFSTRAIKISPYNLEYYVQEVERTHVDDYAVLSHSGHGVNSCAIHYYLVFGPLRIFLQLSWGGVYTNRNEAAAAIHECFLLADRIVAAAMTLGNVSGQLTVVGSDFDRSHWAARGKSLSNKPKIVSEPTVALEEALYWLTSIQP